MKSSSTKISSQKPPGEEKALNDKKSSFALLWCRMTFTDEPLWYRIVVMLIMLAATITIFYFIKEMAFVPTLIKKLSALKIKALIGKTGLP